MRQKKYVKVFYDHLDLVGSYQYETEGGEVKTVRLHYSDIILFERILSFEYAGERFYMTNENIVEQLKMSERTAKNCIKRLCDIGLVRVYYDRPSNGQIKAIRYLYSQADRLEQLLDVRRRQREGELPVDWKVFILRGEVVDVMGAKFA